MDKHTADAIYKLGGPAKAARHLGVTVQAVCQWTRIPIHHVAAVARETGISRHKLRPDVFGAQRRQD